MNIAFVGVNTDGTDNLAFATFSDIAAGTVIHFDTAPQGGTDWSWTATENIAAGSIVTMDGLSSGSATSNHGTIAFASGTGADFSYFGASVYAYLGDAGHPTSYLTAIALGSLANTSDLGLTVGTNAITLPTFVGIAQYVGPRVGLTSYADYIHAINDPHNWVTEAGNSLGGTQADGIAPDVPFPTYGF